MPRDLSLADAQEYFAQLELTDREAKIAAQVLREIRARLNFLLQVGLNYLSLSRSAGSLSGGEAQRIRLATQIGSGLTGVLYVLDEPSIGLHQRDNRRLIETLLTLRDLGNTLIVVEHDEETIHAADWVVDIGPRAGVDGGHVVHSGPLSELLNDTRSITGDYLAGRRSIPTPSKRRRIDKKRMLTVVGARENNLRNVTVDFPLGVMTAVTGVSGSGKSSLVNGILYEVLGDPAQRRPPHRGQAHARDGPGQPRQGRARRPGADRPHAALEPRHLHRRVRPRPDALQRDARGEGARLPAGPVQLQRQGRPLRGVLGRRHDQDRDELPARRVRRLRGVPRQALQPRHALGPLQGQEHRRGARDADRGGRRVFFEPIQAIHRYLKTLVDVGLGYVRLGQSATTLSGGEAQRVKLATELQRRSNGRSVYVLDEPTTGLHFEDVQRLLEVLNGLVDKGNTVIVIEHNLDVIKSSDWIIDLGPEGGSGGGEVIATGTPEQVARAEGSYTGAFLAEVLGISAVRKAG